MGQFWGDAAARYNDAARLYDDAPASFDSDRLEWRLEVAWRGGHQYFAEADARSEAVRSLACYWQRGRPNLVSYDGNGLEWYAPGRMVITLSNHDRRYDPNYTSSPLYGYIAPGKLVRLGVRRAGSTDLAYNTIYNWRFAGYILDIRNFTEIDGCEYTEITCADGWQWLQDRVPYLPAEASETIQAFYQRLLDKLQWPWDTDFTTSETMPYLWAGGNDARKVVHQVAAAVGGHAYIDGRGALGYRSSTDSPTLVQSLEEGELLKEVLINNPWDYQYNVVHLAYAEKYDTVTRSSVWGDSFVPNLSFPTLLTWANTQAEIAIPTSDSVTLSAEYDLDFAYGYDENYAFQVGTPTSSDSRPVEFVAQFFDSTGGAGNDRSGWIDVDFEDGGDGFSVVLTNKYSSTLYSYHLSIAANNIVARRADTNKIVVDNSAGAARRIFAVDSPYLLFDNSAITLTTLQTIANYYSSLITSARVLPTLSIEARPDIQFLDIMDWINVNIASLDLDNDFYIGMIEERWLSPTGQAVLTTLRTEPEVQATSGFLLLESADYILLENGDRILLG